MTIFTQNSRGTTSTDPQILGKIKVSLWKTGLFFFEKYGPHPLPAYCESPCGLFLSYARLIIYLNEGARRNRPLCRPSTRIKPGG